MDRQSSDYTPGTLFFAYNFLDTSNEKTVAKALERFVQTGTLLTIILKLSKDFLILIS